MRYTLFLILVYCLVGCPQTDPMERTVTLGRDVIHAESQRLGVNLGGPNDYGAENYMRNIVPNPGFEPGWWGTVATLYAAADTYQMQGKYWDTAWHTAAIGQEEHHWQGGDWELPLQGLEGEIIDFIHAPVGSSGVEAYTWILDQTVSVADSEPLIVRVREKGNGNPPRPGSSGIQSRYIESPGNDWQAVGTLYFDALARQGSGGDEGGGTLRVMQGLHELEFWAKGPAEIEFVLSRGDTLLFSKELTLTRNWTRIRESFTPDDGYMAGNAPPITLGWKIRSGDGFYLDDLFCGPAGDGAFSDNVVDALRFVQPGVIRGWQGFHGDSLENLLADEFARGPREYRPRGHKASAYGYGIPDLLELCAEVNALPWIVLPPTLSDEEMAALGNYLAPWTATFETIYVEFGNESWGSNNSYDDPFAGGSFVGGTILGAVAHRKFEAMGEIPGVVKIIGGQAAWAGQNEAIRAEAGPDYVIPIAPYFGVLSERYDTLADMFYPLYARAYEDVSTGGPSKTKHVASAVYEINFHTTGGAGGDRSKVNAFVAGQAGGIALPLYCLNYARSFDWKPQAAFTLSQYSSGGVRIWGLYRDLLATGRPRPTGLALALANRAIMGDMVEVEISDVPRIEVPAGNGLAEAIQIPALDAFGWRDGDQWSMMIFNLSVDTAYAVTLGDLKPEDMWVLAAENPLATNEDEENVTLVETDWINLVPPHCAIVLRGHD